MKTNILEEIFLNGTINYHHLHSSDKHVVELQLEQEVLKAESTLLSIQEQKYFNFYLNRAYTDGYNIRNKYAHSSHVIDEETNKKDYLRIMKILVIIALKIQDDLVISKFMCAYESVKKSIHLFTTRI